MNNGTKAVLAILGVLAVLAVATGGFVAGFVTAGVQAMPSISSEGTSTGVTSSRGNPHSLGESTSTVPFSSVVNQVQQMLDNQALVPPVETSLTANTIDGMLKSLGDPYAMYFDKTHYKAFSEMESGAFGGIGVTLGENKQGQAYVVNVIESTPAQKAGVKAGDVFVSIDGTTQPKWTSEQVVKLVRGKPGTTVTVAFRRTGAPDPLTFKITREQIKVPNTEAKIIGPKKNIGYIRLFQFTATAPEDISKAIRELTAKGAKGFVLDIRDNPGGLLESGIDTVSLFVKDGVAVRVDERGKPEHVYNVSGNTVTDAPVVVLVNADSASASEIVAGALQDYGRGTIVGVRSFGKGSVQTVEPLSNGGAVKFTIAHYLTPKKRVINKKGVLPEYIVPMDPSKEATASTDLQLQKAITVMGQKLGQ